MIYMLEVTAYLIAVTIDKENKNIAFVLHIVAGYVVTIAIFVMVY